MCLKTIERISSESKKNMTTITVVGKPVSGYEKYIIYTDGSIYSKYVNGYLSPSVNVDGYLTVSLYKNGKSKTFCVHILVAKHFISNPSNLPIVNHLDMDTENPDVSNLEWANNSRNVLHAIENGPERKARGYEVYQFSLGGELVHIFSSVKEASVHMKCTTTAITRAIRENTMCRKHAWSMNREFVKPHTQCKKVAQLDECGNILNVFDSITDAAEKICISSSHIGSVCKGTRKTSGGFGWKYMEREKVEVAREWESWSIIADYPDYKVSKDGRLYRISTKCVLHPSPHKSGYVKLCIYDNSGNKVNTSMHRLVALAYLPNPNNLPIVNHKDGNKSNNVVDNLEWATKSYNGKHAHATGLITSIKGRTTRAIICKKPNQRKVGKYDLEGNLLCTYDSIGKATKDTWISRSGISAVCRGDKQKTAGGFYWKYED